jgi:hypothetical protein
MYESSASLSTRPTYAQTRANYDYNVKAPKSPFITVFQEARDRFTGRRTSSFELTPGGIPKGGYSPKQVPIFTLPAGISSLGGIIYENTLKSGYTSTTLSPTGHGLITTTQEAGTKVYSIEMEEKPKPISDDMSELMPYNVGGINIWYNPEEGGRPAAEILAEYKETKTKEIIGKSFAEEARKYSKELEELRERKETPLKIGEPLVDWDKLFKAAEERHNVREFMLGFGAVSHGFATEFAISAEAMIPAAASTALSASNLIRQLTGQTRPYLIGGSSVEERIMFVEKPAYVLSTFKFPLLYEAAPTFLGHGAGVILKEASPLISKIPFLNKALATSEKGLGAYKGYNPFAAEKAGQAFFTVGMSAAGGIQSGFTEEGTFSFPRAAGGAAATFGILHTTTELIPSAGSKVFGALSERYGLNNPFVRAQIKPIGEAKQMVEAGVIPQSQLETGSDILKARAASLATEIKVLRGEKGSIIQGIKLPPKGFEFLSPQYRKIKWIESTIANKEKELNLIRKPTISRRSAEDNVKAWFGKEKYLEPEPKVKTYNILGRLVYLESKPFGLLGKEIEIPSGLVIGLKEAKFVPKTMAKSEMGELSTQGSKSITSKPSKHMPTGKLIEIQTTLVNIQTKPLHFIPQATATSQKISTGQANILKIIGTASKLKTKIPTTLAFGYSSVFAQARIQTQSTTQAQARAQAQAQAQAQTQTQAQAQAQALTQTLTQAQTQAQTLTMLTTKVPERPKTGLKFELYQFLSSSKRKKNKKIRIGSQYHPSIAAMLLGIRGKVQKGKVYTGLELRPIPLLKKRGKNNGKL